MCKIWVSFKKFNLSTTGTHFDLCMLGDDKKAGTDVPNADFQGNENSRCGVAFVTVQNKRRECIIVLVITNKIKTFF